MVFSVLSSKPPVDVWLTVSVEGPLTSPEPHTLQMSVPFVTVMFWLADHYLPLKLFSPMFMRRKTQLYEIPQ